MSNAEGTSSPVPAQPRPSTPPSETSSAAADRTVVGLPTLSDPEAWVGQNLGKYEIVSLLGQGGMGLVFRAFDPTIERDVAIKVLSGAVSQDATALQRFQVEARTAGKLSHPNVVTVYEIGNEGLTNYLVQEFVEGESAAAHLEERGRYAPAEATRIMIEACKGLGAAHALGLVHRDIKPANILVSRDGSVKVADFGLAKQAGAGSGVTVAGQILGTPHFMSPEQCQSSDVDFRSDIYSLGATYYALLSGQNPYAESGSVMQVMFAHCQSDAPDPRELSSTVPKACVDVIRQAMAKRPEERYRSMEAMQRDLEAILSAMSGSNVVLPSQSGTSLPRLEQLSSSSSIRPPVAAVNSSAALPPAGTNRSRHIGKLVGGIMLAAAAIGIGVLLRNSAVQSPGDPQGSKGARQAVSAVPGTPTIRVGVLHSLSGTMADSEGPVVDATLLAIDQINEQGGIGGLAIEPIVVDGRSDPSTFAREAERLINEEHVCTVFGCWTSASRKTVVPVFESYDHLLIYPVQYEGVEMSPNVIYTGAAPNQQIIPAVRWAIESLGRRKVFLVGSDYVFPRVANEIIKDQLTELGGELAGEAYLPLGSYEVDAIIEQILSAQPDVILNTVNGDSNEQLFRSLRKAGITPETTPTISFSIGEAQLLQLDLNMIQGDYAAWNYFQSIDTPENKDFVAAFKDRYGPQRTITDPMESAYIGVKLWAAALAELEISAESPPQPADIRRAMRNQRLMAPEGEVRIDPQTQHTFKTPRIGRIRSDGQFDVIWADTAPEPPIVFPHSRKAAEWNALLNDLYTGWNDSWAAPSD